MRNPASSIRKSEPVDGRPWPGSHKRAGGFTLIELLVAMTILLIITLIVAQIFQQANRAWDTGMNKVEVNMKGRAIVDFIASELSQAVYDPGRVYHSFLASDDKAEFWVLKDAIPRARSIYSVQYDGIKRTVKYTKFSSIYDSDLGEQGDDLVKPNKVKKLQFDSVGGNGGLPYYTTVTLTITDAYGQDKSYSSVVYFKNRDRNRF